MTRHAQTPCSALVLAGRRGGALDPLAEAAGVTHKCLVPVAGRTMLLHPLAALAGARGVARVVVCIDDVGALHAWVDAAALGLAGRLEIVAGCANLVDSVLAAAEHAAFPLLITTADNVLLTPLAVDASCAAAEASGADATVGFARREDVLSAHPDGQRRFYRFACGEYSNCNLYWVRNRRALAAAQVFRSGGQFAKHPLRIAWALGAVNLLRFRLGIGTLEGALARIFRRLRVAIRPVVIADGAVAIDVDNARTKQVAEEVLAARSLTDRPDRRSVAQPA